MVREKGIKYVQTWEAGGDNIIAVWAYTNEEILDEDLRHYYFGNFLCPDDDKIHVNKKNPFFIKNKITREEVNRKDVLETQDFKEWVKRSTEKHTFLICRYDKAT